jgi:hypothetical protein
VKAPKSTNTVCRLDVRFAQTEEGRPEIYDFLWDHLPSLYAQSGEKKIRIHVQPGWTKALTPVQWDHLVQKLTQDRRFNHSIERVNVGTRSLEVVVPVKELENMLSTYNIFFDGVLPFLQFNGEKMSIDFSPAEKQSVIIQTDEKQSERVKSYLSSTLNQSRIRTMRFGVSNPLHDALSKRGRR